MSAESPKNPVKRKPTVRQARFVEGLAEGKSARRAAREAPRALRARATRAGDWEDSFMAGLVEQARRAPREGSHLRTARAPGHLPTRTRQNPLRSVVRGRRHVPGRHGTGG